MNEVTLPIKTIKDGNKITKICVEDIYKIINRIQDCLYKTLNESQEILDSVHKQYDGYEGELIIGTGVSQPCLDDVYDEEIGNNIAFMKAKLNANLKKYKLIWRVYQKLRTTQENIAGELDKIAYYIDMDTKGVRKYNPLFRAFDEF